MKIIKDILLELEQKIDIPQPAKAHLILEIRNDMLDYYETLTEMKYDKNRINQVIKERFTLSETEIEDLEKIHNSLVVRLFNKIPRIQKYEKIILLGVLIVIAATIGYASMNSQIFRGVPWLIIPVIFAAVLILLNFIRKFYELYIKKQHNLRTTKYGVRQTFYLSCFAVISGLFGFFYHLSQNAGFFVLVLQNILSVNQVDLSNKYMMEGYLDSAIGLSGIGMITIAVSLFGFTVWFMLENKVMMIENLELSKILSS